MMHPFELLAEPLRRRLVEVLALGEHTAGELISVGCGEFSVTRAAVSHHLRILRREDAVLVEVDESSRVYRLNPELLESLDATVEDLKTLWEQRYGSRYGRGPRILPLPDPGWAASGSIGLRGADPYSALLASAGSDSANADSTDAYGTGHDDAGSGVRPHRVAARRSRGKRARHDPWTPR
ncbi:MAG: ArsR family transcriptional regulator [Microbacteriaceae bacterium]|nr:MAG: ArsR family transcriptional regulator [Microbacteriaceae bacterium]